MTKRWQYSILLPVVLIALLFGAMYMHHANINARFVALWSDHSGDLDLNKIQDELTPRAVYQALEAGADVNAKDSRGGTALLAVATRGDTDLSNILLAAGANINARDSEGQTALSVASQGAWFTDLGSNLIGFPDLVALLLDRGATVNARDKAGETALMIAAHKGEAKVVRLLLEHGADTNLAKNDGSTPLLAALDAPQEADLPSIFGLQIAGNTEIIHLLLTHGADVNTKDKTGQTALSRAMQHRNLWVDGLPDTDKQEHAALDQAMQRHRAEIIKLLNTAGAK